MVGKTLGHYEILEPLGAGGMGEVYRARDTKLDRDVAIKVLPEDFATDQERLARFEREAKLLASLNHPNIAAIYGLEDEGEQRFIVMEVVEGETLAERISSGPVEVDEALEIARQIAEALEAAHENGVIHRDLKPANVVVTPEGKAKVLDFGLAKSYEAGGSSSDVSPDLSHSPTMMEATRTGVILGTAAYMSPEQARGKPVDKRTDIFAFGALLYEMLTGTPAFDGETVTDVLASVVKDDPQWDALPPETPPLVRSLLRRCLGKDPAGRLHDIADARIEIVEALSEPVGDVPGAQEARQAPSSRWAFGLGGLAGGVLIGFVLALQFGAGGGGRDSTPLSSAAGPPTAGEVVLAESARVAYGVAAIGIDCTLVAVSPSGEWLVYVGVAEGGSMLYRKSLRDHEPAVPLDGTEGAIHAFFSPDGETIGFLTDDQLKRISILGDDLRTISDTRTAVRGWWTNDDWIYFAENEGGTLRRVRATTAGMVEDVRSSLGLFTDVSSDGKTALYTANERGISSDYGTVHLLDLDSGTDTAILESAYDARFAPTGHLIFGRGGNLLAVSFDSEVGMPRGDEMTVVRNVAMDSLFGHMQAALSDAGTLVHLPGGDRAIGRIVEVDRQGEERIMAPPARIYGVLDLSPDDSRLAYQIADVNDAIRIHEIGQAEEEELSRGGMSGWPVWNDRGDAITYVTGSGAVERTLVIQNIGEGLQTITTLPLWAITSDWGSTGEIAFSSFETTNIGFWSPEKPEDVEWVETPGVYQWGAAFSPDGRHIAYTSDETGQNEIWVKGRAEGPSGRPVSLDGGMEAVWCACDEIFFRRGRQIFSAVVRPRGDADSVTWETPRPVFEITGFVDTPGISYDVSSDGQLLYAVKRAEAAIDTRVRLTYNWFEELKRLVPTDGSR